MMKISYHCPMSSLIKIRFNNELNDFLLPEQPGAVVSYELKLPRSVKDLIESIGVPHTEIDLIIVNGKSVDLNYTVQNGDQISLYPTLKQGVNELQTISPLIHCQPEPLDEYRFILDVHLGRLAAYLRMLGFDALYQNDYDDLTLANISANEARMLLTCDRQLLMRKQIQHGYFVRARQPKQQLLEVLSRFDLYDKQKPFSRCMYCNGITQPVDKQKIKDQLQARTRKYYSVFIQCEECKKIYWEGGHYLRMQAMIDSINQNT
ncbi:MAG: Mut7-C ubiquitin/RNAse domain-containing protein [Gammaproteobacteria bacterium]|nr:Mut7-C ubiquitin/RNAse domain-containing protein [Gammaproteobacteria bacterium]